MVGEHRVERGTAGRPASVIYETDGRRAGPPSKEEGVLSPRCRPAERAGRPGGWLRRNNSADNGPSPRIVDTVLVDYAAVGSVAARWAS